MSGSIRLTVLLVLLMFTFIHGTKNIKTKDIKGLYNKSFLSKDGKRHLFTTSKALCSNTKPNTKTKLHTDQKYAEQRRYTSSNNSSNQFKQEGKEDKYKNSFGMQYLNYKNHNEEDMPHDENIPWYRRWWRKIAGGTVAAGLFSYANQSSEKENIKQQPLNFSLPYFARSTTKDGKVINLQEIFNKVSPSTPIETSFEDNDTKCHFKIEEIITKNYWGYEVNIIKITSTIKTKDDVFEKIDTTAFPIPETKDISNQCHIGNDINKDGSIEGRCNCKFEFLKTNSNALLPYI